MQGNPKARIGLSDREVRLLISSLDKRIKRILHVRGRLHGEELTQANDCLEECSDLLYKLRMMRKTAPTDS